MFVYHVTFELITNVHRFVCKVSRVVGLSPLNGEECLWSLVCIGVGFSWYGHDKGFGNY